MHKFTLRDRVRYRFDDMMSRGPFVSIGWLFLGALVFILLLTVIVRGLDIAPHHADNTALGWHEVIWFSILQTLNANLLVGDFNNSAFMVAVVGATIAGLLLIGSLIGLLTSGIQNRLEQFRKGRSFVVEQNHIVVLGWSENIFTILSELISANEHHRAVIVILANQDKVAMEDAIREHVHNPGHTRIVCRTGEPIDLHDLALVNPHGARVVIILPPDEEYPDANVIKTILALTNHPDRRADRFKIVAQLRDPENVSAAMAVGGDEVQLVIAHELIAHLIVQTLRQTGLSLIYTFLLDFEGDEIYFAAEPRLVGKAFGAALSAFEDSSLIGLFTGDGRILLNPPMDTLIGAQDRLIAISRDDDTVIMNGSSDVKVDEREIHLTQHPVPRVKRILFLGWNDWAMHVMRELDDFVAAGSEVLVVAEEPEVEALVARANSSLANQRVTFRPGNPSDRVMLHQLDVPSFNHVVTLSDTTQRSASQADARTLITLLYLREIGEQTEHPFSIVSEILDERTRQLAEVTRADDFIVSSRLVSLMFAQLAENPEIAAVYTDLFDPQGAELYLKPVSDYVAAGDALNFYTVVEAARRHGECAIGYRVQADSGNASRMYGIVLNPPKSKPVTFTENDRVIVLANQ